MQWAAIFHKHDVRITKGIDYLNFYNSELNKHERILPCKVSCALCGTLIADEGRNMWLAFPSLFNFGGVSKVPTKFKSTCHIISSQRVVIFGERRIGKTSAVYEAMSRCKNVRMLYVDLLGIKSVDGMCRRILKAIVVHEQKKGWFEKIFKVLAHLRPSISVDPVTSLPTVSFDSSTDRLLTNIQLKVLAAIAREGGKQVFSAAFMKPSGFTNPSTVRRAVNRLLQLNILFESSGEYRFVNPFFRAWIISRG